MVEYTDGFGKKVTQLAVIIPGVGVTFIPDKFQTQPAQGWLRDAILKKIG